ncbi:MAG: hypothetical protein AB8H86_32435 [Polyangiales bacterium]
MHRRDTSSPSHRGSSQDALGVVWVLLMLGGCVGQLVATSPEADAGTPDDVVSVDAGPSIDSALVDGSPQDSGRDAFISDVPVVDVPVGSDAGPGDPCEDVTCGRNETCVDGDCVCSEGFERMGGDCTPGVMGSDPLTHTEAQVCAFWQESATVSAGAFEVSDMECDPGALSAAAISEGMRRINAYRWFAGLGPTSTAVSHVQAQGCALVSAWNPAGPQAHNPEPSAVCYTEDGAAGAGSSNIAWGSRSTVNAIDQWVEDRGNQTTMGHRRWILNPPLSDVQLGLYEGGTSFGGAACMSVFGRGGAGRTPDWFAFPPPGFIPTGLPITTWTFHASWSFAETAVTVTRVSDGEDLPVEIFPLRQTGFGYPNATSFRPMGWSAESGETYRVLVVAGENTATYEVSPIDC